MNKEELLKEYDEKAKALRDEFISKLEDDKKEFELTYPEDETVYIINYLENEVNWTVFTKKSTQLLNAYMNGNVFRTSKEAEQHLKERKLLFKLHQYAKEKNDGWELDWSNGDEEKYYIFYSNSDRYLKISSAFSLERFNKLPYFKTREITQECIDLFGDEIKEVLC